GCVLAPTLFSLYINDLVHFLKQSNHDSPRLNGDPVPALLFADDTILLSQTPMGLQTLLDKFSDYCSLKGLEINTSKTKYLTVNPHKALKRNIRI
ncbi:hypothetical protein NDU88_001727, partial [Pleurodeles waltl]